ncbi:hypothetical protein E2C01_069264 [Portunus trituberculatus]|uniref:Uncharacterized protein n=1 Tax=Portunus trituberculatus TaxID=210409 RepID=A0A5B7HYF5_PORTR|nr:hypothetical protein [Portunus trituberculatus]
MGKPCEENTLRYVSRWPHWGGVRQRDSAAAAGSGRETSACVAPLHTAAQSWSLLCLLDISIPVYFAHALFLRHSEAKESINPHTTAEAQSINLLPLSTK